MKFQYDATVVLKETLTDSAGGNSIFRAVKQWTHQPMDNQTVQSCAPGYQLAIDCAVHSQSAIGWSKLFRGLVSFQWGHVANIPDLSHSRERRSQKSINHLAVVIRALQDYSLAIWKSRNETLHRMLSVVVKLFSRHNSTMRSPPCTISEIHSLPSSKAICISMPLIECLLCLFRQKQRWL